MAKTVKQRYEEYGYTVCHLFGHWYLVRHWSKNYKKFSWYDLTRI